MLFSVLRERFDEQPWNAGRRRSFAAIRTPSRSLRAELHERLDEERFLQFAFFEQWSALRSYCAAARHSRHRRRRHLRQLRQRRRVDASRNFSPEAGLHPRWSPACRPTPSARPASAGAIRCMTGTRCERAATTGGSGACAGRLRPATSCASIISAALKRTGRFLRRSRRRLMATG